jgi:hypothetical protein
LSAAGVIANIAPSRFTSEEEREGEIASRRVVRLDDGENGSARATNR